jgi:hypothetical protein
MLAMPSINERIGVTPHQVWELLTLVLNGGLLD